MAGQKDSTIDRDFFVISTVGETDTVGVLKMKKWGLYEFESYNKVDYKDFLVPVFLVQRSGKYKIKEVVKGAFVVDFSPDEKNKSYNTTLASELGINCREQICTMDYLASRMDGWYIVSRK